MSTKFNSWPFPAVGFYYEVSIDGGSGIQAAFQEVSGIEVKNEIEVVSEAGLNQYSHRLPKKTSYDNLTLKRGLYAQDSEMQEWVTGTLQEGLLAFVVPKDIIITLMDENGDQVMGWNFHRAYPVKWSVSGLNSMQSAVVIESIELAYQYWKFI